MGRGGKNKGRWNKNMVTNEKNTGRWERNGGRSGRNNDTETQVMCLFERRLHLSIELLAGRETATERALNTIHFSPLQRSSCGWEERFKKHLAQIPTNKHPACACARAG